MAPNPVSIQWWVINQVSRPGGARGPQQTNYVIRESPVRPTNAVAGPFSTHAEAAAWQTGANTAGNSPGSVIGKVGDLTGIPAIGDFFNRLTQQNTWVRVAEFLVGGILIVVGASSIFAKSDTGQALQRTAIKTAATIK